ncbi:MAG TPA: glycosyltransferase [Patescibacteria group bacterium]|nr:glycosyltransferase [Patescibacteria group bacterium]
MKSTLEVLHLSTHNERCGIAIYQQSIVDAMGEEEAIHNVFFDVSPNKLKLLKGAEFEAVLQKLFKQLEDFDILHIQMEYSFFNDDQLRRIVDGASSKNVKILFTLHTPPHARREHSQTAIVTLNPRSWLSALRISKARNKFIESYIQPLKKADCLIVPSQAAMDSFVAYGVPQSLIKIIELPVPKPEKGVDSTEITDNLQKQPGDVILSTFGFIAETKGIIPLIRSLTFLPANYKLAIIGGAHPTGLNDAFYDQACDLIYGLGLRDRVYITGYVATDAQRDAFLRETDICIYAYDRAYYDYVSSAALNNAVANELPIVAYRNRTFEEANKVAPFITFCQSANYYEIARTVKSLDRKEGSDLTAKYAQAVTIEKQAKLFAEVYQQLSS